MTCHPKRERSKALDVGRRENRTYVKLSGTIDSNLHELFEKERSERGLSVGKLLDAILWDRYGRPKLTYESE